MSALGQKRTSRVDRIVGLLELLNPDHRLVGFGRDGLNSRQTPLVKPASPPCEWTVVGFQSE